MRRLRSGPPKGVQPIPRQTSLTSPSRLPIERLSLTVLRRLDGLLVGDHAGVFPGHSTERGEARPYVPGDDPRHIDWAVSARNHEPHVRDMIADHELDVWLVLDSSSSMGFGTGRATKHEVAWSAVGAFGLLAARGGNRVGAVRTTPRAGKSRPWMAPARGGSTHIGGILAALQRAPEDDEPGDLSASLEMIARGARRRGMVVVASDFLGETTWERPMRAMSHRHEVIAIEVVDIRELTLPDVGLISVVDPETGRRRLVDTAAPFVGERYARLATERRRDLSDRLKRSGADHLALSTDRDWVLDFVRFVSSRKARLASAGRSR